MEVERVWRRGIGTPFDNDGIATCDNCFTRGLTWTDGKIKLCRECLGDIYENVRSNNDGGIMNKVDVDRRSGRKTDGVWIITVSVHMRYRNTVLDILEDAEFVDLLDEIGKTDINAFLSNLATDDDIDGLEKELKRAVRDGRKAVLYNRYYRPMARMRCDGCRRRLCCGWDS